MLKSPSTMRTILTFLLLAITAVWADASVFAEVKSGPSFFGGIAQHDAEGAGFDSGYSSMGSSFGADYQFPFGSIFSFNPFFVTSRENADGAIAAGTRVAHQIIGAETRMHLGPIFFGLHMGRYEQVLDQPFTDEAGGSGGSGLGFGYTLGWKLENSHYFSFQFDVAESGLGGTLIGFRLQLGYRWNLVGGS